MSNSVEVANLDYDTCGIGKAFLDPKLMLIFDLKDGDTIEIKGTKKTCVKVSSANSSDYGKGLMRISNSTMRNAGTGVNNAVEVRKINTEKAERVVLSSLDKIVFKDMDKLLRNELVSCPIMRGDIISLSIGKKIGAISSHDYISPEISVIDKKIEFVVTSFLPDKDVLSITPYTEIKFDFESTPVDIYRVSSNISKITYDDIGGLDDKIKQVREIVELPIKHPELFERLKIEVPKGILLYGPPGTGKTMIAKAVANETKANFISIGGPEIISSYYGKSEEALRNIFKKAEETQPSIIFIDEIDSIAPKRDKSTSTEEEIKVVSQLLTLMDGLESRGRIIVIGATNRQNSIDEALRRPGRFDREINISMPTRAGRYEILMKHTKDMPLAENVDIEKLADETYGYTGADLSALAKEAAIASLRRVLPDATEPNFIITNEMINNIWVEKEDFDSVLKAMSPSMMREVLIEKPNVGWNDIGISPSVKKELVETVDWPIRYRKIYKDLKVKSPKGLLLYGPSGTGKTMLAKVIATEAKANFISIKASEFKNHWYGESEKAVRELFKKARLNHPCIIFIDEIDSITHKREVMSDRPGEGILSQILIEMDGLESLNDVMVVAATNNKDHVDPSLLRPGRFDKIVLIDYPEHSLRKEIYKIHTKNMQLSSDVDYDYLASKSEGLTGATIFAICNEALMEEMRKLVNDIDNGKIKNSDDTVIECKITKEDFDTALNKYVIDSKTEITANTCKSI